MCCRLSAWSQSAFMKGHVEINMENRLNPKITDRWWELMMCAVLAVGARWENTDGAFNCSWLRPVGRVWAKPIIRLEEKVRNHAQENVQPGWQTAQAVLCACVCMETDYWSRLPASEVQSVPVQPTAENVTWHMWFHVAIVLFFLFLDPLKLKRPGPLQKYVPNESRAKTLVRPGTKTERKALLRKQLFGLKWLMWCRVSPIVFHSHKWFKMKRKAVTWIYDALCRWETSHRMRNLGFSSLYHVSRCTTTLTDAPGVLLGMAEGNYTYQRGDISHTHTREHWSVHVFLCMLTLSLLMCIQHVRACLSLRAQADVCFCSTHMQMTQSVAGRLVGERWCSLWQENPLAWSLL